MNEYILFLALVPILYLLARFAEKNNKTVFVWLIVLLLSCISGFRSLSVGFDTVSYYGKYDMINQGRFEYAYGLEESFKYFTYIIQRIFNNYNFYLFVIAFITNSLIIFRLWSLKKESMFTVMVLCYYASFYQMTMNGMRQFLAASFVFYGTMYLSKKRIYTFLAFVLMGMIFHRSAFIGGLYIFTYFFFWKTLKKKEKTLLAIILACIPVALILLKPYIIYYSRFFEDINVSIGKMMPIKLMFFIITFYLLKKSKRIEQDAEESYSIDVFIISSFYLLSIILSFFGYVFELIERVAWYFYLYEGVYFGLLMRRLSGTQKILVGGFILLMIGYIFMYSLTNNSQGIFPYSMF